MLGKMVRNNESGITIKSTFKERIKHFMEENPGMFASVPEALRFAWYKFEMEYNQTYKDENIKKLREHIEELKDR